jgi:hypothetical protein
MFRVISVGQKHGPRDFEHYLLRLFLTHTAQVGAFVDEKMCTIILFFSCVFIKLFIYPLKVKNKPYDGIANTCIYS